MQIFLACRQVATPSEDLKPLFKTLCWRYGLLMAAGSVAALLGVWCSGATSAPEQVDSDQIAPDCKALTRQRQQDLADLVSQPGLPYEPTELEAAFCRAYEFEQQLDFAGQGVWMADYLRSFKDRTLSDAELYVNYFLVADPALRPVLLNYVDYATDFRERFIPACPAQRDPEKIKDLNAELAQFQALENYLRPEVLDFLKEFNYTALNDLPVAYGMLHKSPDRIFAKNSQQLKQGLQAGRGLLHERADDETSELSHGIEDLSEIDLVKAYVLRKQLRDRPELRQKIGTLIAQDLQNHVTELGGAVHLDMDQDQLDFIAIDPQPDFEDENPNDSYQVVDKMAWARADNFARFHLHATEADDCAYAGPSESDIMSSIVLNFASEVVITACGSGRFNAHYYRGYSAYPYNGVVWNLGLYEYEVSAPEDTPQ